MKAKPICVVYLPPTDIGHKVTWELCEQLSRDYEESRPDYHWFFFPGNSHTEIEFKVFYEKDFIPIKYEELKKIILDSIP